MAKQYPQWVKNATDRATYDRALARKRKGAKASGKKASLLDKAKRGAKRAASEAKKTVAKAKKSVKRRKSSKNTNIAEHITEKKDQVRRFIELFGK